MSKRPRSERDKARRREYEKENAAKIRAQNTAWREKNRERIKEGQRRRYLKNRDKNIAVAMSRYSEHREEIAEARRDKARARSQQIRLLLIAFMGGKCVTCGFSDWRALQVDHIHGGGRADRAGKNPCNFYRTLLKKPDPSKYQLLCANCNTIKRHERKEHRKGGIAPDPENNSGRFDSSLVLKTSSST